MAIQRFPKKSDFAFLSVLWDLVKHPRRGALCCDEIPSLMKANGFERVEQSGVVFDFVFWAHPSLYGDWSVTFAPGTETLWITQANKWAWENPKVLKIEDPAEMRLDAVQACVYS